MTRPTTRPVTGWEGLDRLGAGLAEADGAGEAAAVLAGRGTQEVAGGESTLSVAVKAEAARESVGSGSVPRVASSEVPTSVAGASVASEGVASVGEAVGAAVGGKARMETVCSWTSAAVVRGEAKAKADEATLDMSDVDGVAEAGRPAADDSVSSVSTVEYALSPDSDEAVTDDTPALVDDVPVFVLLRLAVFDDARRVVLAVAGPVLAGGPSDKLNEVEAETSIDDGNPLL